MTTFATVVPGGVFISYRGDDSDTAAVLIDRELTARLGSDRVFLDSRSIPAGTDFAEELLRTLRVCSVLVVVIGPRWLTLTDSAGERRIDDPKDWTRREIATALAHGLRVIPVLTGEAALPTESELPADIAALSRRQWLQLRRRHTPLDLAFLVERITGADPELASAAARRQSSAERVPRQLPAAVAHFAGRTAELATLTDLLRRRTETGGTVVISAISGTAGVGKTALAVHWAHQAADDFPDGQLYVNLRGFDSSGKAMAPEEAVRSFLDALHVPPERIPVDLEAQAALYRSQLAGKRMLVLLDNARDSAQVRSLLPGARTCLVIVTSRHQLTSLIAADNAHSINLDLLTDREARQLLAQRLGADQVAAEPDAVEEIITRCARLPLALALVAAHATIRPNGGLRQLAAELRDTQQRWLTLTGDDPTTDVRTVFSWSYHALTPDAARLFRLFGLHPGPDLSAAAATSLTGSGTIRPVLTELTRASLLVEYPLGRYSLHDLLRSYATYLAHTIDSRRQRHTATLRVLEHYLHTAHAANRLIDPTRDPITLTPPQPQVAPEHLADHQQAMDWLTVEHPVLRAAVDHAVATGFDHAAWRLSWTLRTFLHRRGHWRDLAAIGGIAVAAGQRLAHPGAQSHGHHTLADAYIRLGRFDDAHVHLSHALDLTTRIGDRTGQAHTHVHLGYLWSKRNDYPRALDHAEQALDLYRITGHQIGQALALRAVGWYHGLAGEHRKALTACGQALTLNQDLGNRYGQALTWDSLGYAHHQLGHNTQAITCYQQARTLFRDLGDQYNEAEILTHLGDAHRAARDLETACDIWRQALAILDDLDHPDADQVRVRLHEAGTPTMCPLVADLD